MTGDWFTVTIGAYKANQNRHINLIHLTATANPIFCKKKLCAQKLLFNRNLLHHTCVLTLVCDRVLDKFVELVGVVKAVAPGLLEMVAMICPWAFSSN